MRNGVLRHFCIILLILATATTAPVVATAGGWFSKFSDNVMVNDSSAFKTQKMGHYAMGGFSYRSKVDRTPFLHITPPRIEAGCGGIDAFWGGFSFLNLEHLIQKFKNIMMAAPAFAFNLALQKLCSPCYNILQSLEAIANELNALAMDDCKAASALVQAGYGAVKSMLDMDADQGETDGGGATWLEEKLTKLQNGLKDFRKDYDKLLDYKYCSQADNKEECRNKVKIEGSLWDMIKERSKNRNADYVIDDAFLEIARAFFGDVVFYTPDKVPDSAKNSGSAMTGGTVESLGSCDAALTGILDVMTSTSFGGSGSPAPENIMVQIANSSGFCDDPKPAKNINMFKNDQFYFGKKASKAIDDIQNAIAVPGADISGDTITLINQSAIPVYYAINTLSLRPGGSLSVGDGEKGAIMEMLAIGHTMYVMEQFYMTTNEVLQDLKVHIASVGPTSLYTPDSIEKAYEAISSRMMIVRGKLGNKYEQSRAKYNDSINGILTLTSIRNMLMSNAGSWGIR